MHQQVETPQQELDGIPCKVGGDLDDRPVCLVWKSGSEQTFWNHIPSPQYATPEIDFWRIASGCTKK